MRNLPKTSFFFLLLHSVFPAIFPKDKNIIYHLRTVPHTRVFECNLRHYYIIIHNYYCSYKWLYNRLIQYKAPSAVFVLYTDRWIDKATRLFEHRFISTLSKIIDILNKSIRIRYANQTLTMIVGRSVRDSLEIDRLKIIQNVRNSSL